MTTPAQMQEDQIVTEKSDSRKPKPKQKYEFSEHLIKGAYIDAKDTVNNWCVAQVVERDDSDDTIKINFDGWSHKWDEWYKFTSSKIAPFRKYSQGYTGQVRYAIRDWKYHPEELEERSKQLDQYLSKGIIGSFSSPQELTQTIRGSDFIYLDGILQHEYRNPKEEFPASVNYFVKHFRLYIDVLKMIPEFLPEYNEGLSNLDAFLTNERVAAIHSIYELSDSVNKIFGSCKRCWSHFSVYDREDIPIKISKGREFAGQDYKVSYVGRNDLEEDQQGAENEEEVKYSHLIVELINAFGELGGFNEWLRVFTYCAQDPKTNEYTLIPFKMMLIMLTNISTIYNYLNKSFVATLMPKIKDAIARRYKYITNKEMKDLDKDLAMKLLQKAQVVLCQFYKAEEIYEFTEIAELELAFKFLTCQYLEKRLKGINEIKEISEKIEFHEYYMKTNNLQAVIASQKSTKYLNASRFVKWVLNNKVFELILGDSIHIEIVKRCSDVLKFMAKFDTIPLEIVDLFWSACEGKHEALVRAIYDTIIEISSVLTKEGAERIHSKILAIPHEEINDIHLNLIKGFAINTLPRNYDVADVIKAQESTDDTGDEETEKKPREIKHPREEVNENDFYCVPLLWSLMLDSSNSNPHSAELALTVLSTVLKEGPCQKLKRLYLYECFENLKKNESVSQSINLAHYILTNTYYNTQLVHENSLSTILEELDGKFSIVESIISDMEVYQARVKKTLETQKDYSKSNTALREKLRVGKYPYHINFNNRLVFLEFMITYPYYEMFLTEKQIERIWSLYNENALFDWDQSCLLKWMGRREMNRYSDSMLILRKKEVPFFFNEILSDKSKFSYENMTQDGFSCFETYFKVINQLENKFRIGKSSNFKVIDLDYIGKNQLWEMFLVCKNRDTLDMIVNLILECQVRIDDSLEEKKGVLWEELSSRCMSLLKEGNASKNSKLIDRAVLLLMKFFDKFEGKSEHESDSRSPEHYRYMHMMNVVVVLKPTNASKTIQIGYMQTLGTLRKKIGEAFGLNLNEFKITAKGALIDREEDEMQINEYGFTGPFVIHKVQVSANQGNFHPKNIIASNQEYIDLLFSLLSSDSSDTVKSIWDVLMRLPTNINIKKKIYLLNDPWETILDSSNIYRLLYCLQIVEEFAYDRERERNNPPDFGQCPSIEFTDFEWVTKFLQKNGLQYLLKIAVTLSSSGLKGLHSLMAITLVLKLVCYFQTLTPLEHAYGNDYQSVSADLAPRMLGIIHEVCQYSLAREKTEAGSDLSEQPSIKIGNQNESYRVPVTLYYESEAILYAQTIFLLLVDSNSNLLEHLYTFKHLESLLNVGLLESNNGYLKEKLSNGLLSLFTKFSESNLSTKPHQFFIPLLLQKTLDNALLKEERSDVFFRLISNTISNLDIGDISKESLDVDHLMDRLTHVIEHRKPVEKSAKENDAVLIGILQVLRALFLRFPEKCKHYGQNRGLVKELLHNCLFEMPKNADKSSIPPPKCKSYQSRQAAFRLLLALASQCNENLHETIQFIAPIHIEGHWRTKRYHDWYITAKENEKSLTGYVGLKNLGCICYMNSQLQQLYMIPAFRKAVMEVDDLGYEGTPREDNILYHLKCIFYGLAQSEKQYFNPKGFCHAFKDLDGNPTNVFEQMDSEEFFNIFMDRLENLTKDTKEQNFIKDIFGGTLSNELIADDGGKKLYREREEPFLTIGLQVKNKKTIEQSLKAFIEGEMLEGDNAYMWEEANKKCNTLKRACLKRLPNYLIFVLKRFEFDFDTMQRQKVNDYFEFPNRLNLEPYTQQGLRKAEEAKKKGKSEEESAEGNKAENPDEFPSEYFDYKLTGIVIHLGTADSGHYYSLIQDREADPSIPEEKRWIEFNDTIVTPFDPKDIPNEAFGGEEKYSQIPFNFTYIDLLYYNRWRYHSVGGDATGSLHEKMKNAYLLFYERVTPIKESDLKKPTGDTSEENKESDGKVIKGDDGAIDKKEAQLAKQKSTQISHAVPEDFLKDLHEDNMKFHVHKHIFSREYFDFVSELVFQRSYAPNPAFIKNAGEIEKYLESSALSEFELLKMGVIFLLTAVIRDKSRTNIVRFLPGIKQILSNNIPACEWIIYNFTSPKVILEFFLENPIGDMRKFVIGLVSAAFSRLYEEEIKGNPQKLYEKDPATGAPTTIAANFINCLISMTFASKYSREYTDFFKIFYRMARCGPEVAAYLIKHKFIGRLLDFFFEKASPHNQFFRDMSDVKYVENEKPAIGLAKEEKQKVRTALDELLARRKGRTYNESYSSQRGYLWQTLCYLVRHCRLAKGSKRCDWQIGQLDLEIISEERTLLLPEAFFVLKVLEDSSSKLAMKSNTLLYSYLCYEDPKFTDTYVEAIKKGLDKEVSELRAYFKALYTLASLEDSLSDQRCQLLCQMLCKLAKDNSNYYLETDAFTTFAYKYASRNDRAKAWFAQNKDQWSWMVQWLQQHQNPPMGIIQSGMKLHKRRLGLREMKAHIALKTRRFQDLLEDKIEENKNTWDSDDDLSDSEFQLGQTLDYLDLSRNKWVTGTVETILEEMINVAYGSENTWITRDSEIIAPYQAMKSHQDLLEKEGAKLEEAEAPAPQRNQGQDHGDQETGESGYRGLGDDSDSNSVDSLKGNP